MGYWIVDGRRMTDEEHDQWEIQKKLQKEKIQEESARLSRQLGAAYAALKEHLERNPSTSHKITDERALEQQIYCNLRQNLHRADQAPRCGWIREDGTVCKSPRMKERHLLLRPLPDEACKSGESAASGANGRECDPDGGDRGATGAD